MLVAEGRPVDEYCVLIVLTANDYLSDPNDTHDTQSAYMGEYMRGLGI